MNTRFSPYPVQNPSHVTLRAPLPCHVNLTKPSIAYNKLRANISMLSIKNYNMLKIKVSYIDRIEIWTYFRYRLPTAHAIVTAAYCQIKKSRLFF